MIYSEATIQWIPEDIAFAKTFDLLKPGGIRAMIRIKSDYKTPDEELYNRTQKVYDAYWKPENRYKDMCLPFSYANAVNYGYVDFEKREFYGKRVFTADEYVALSGTHVDHICMAEPYKSLFFNGLREAVPEAGNKTEFYDTCELFFARKPLANV